MEGNIISKKHSKKNIAWFFVILLFFFGIVYIFNRQTVLYTDDYKFALSYVTGERVTTIGEAIESFKDFCINERANVRLASLLSMIFMMMNKQVFNVLNSVLYILLNILVYYNAFGFKRKLSTLGIASILSFIFLLIPAYGQSFLWVTGSANYLCPILGALLFLLPYRNAYFNRDKKSKNKLIGILFAVFIFIYSFFAAWMHEQVALVMIIVSISFIIGYKLNDIKIKLWMFTGVLGSMVGFVLVTLGSMRRLQDESSASGNIVVMIIKNLVMITIKLFYYLMPLIILMFGILLFWYLKRKDIEISKKFIFNVIKDNMNVIAYIMGGLAACYSMIIVPIFAIRAWCAPVMMFILAVVSLFPKLLDYIDVAYKNKFDKANNLITLTVVICLLCSTVIEYSRVSDVATQFNERKDYILTQKDKGNLNVEVPLVKGISKYDVYYYADGFDVGEHNNEEMAKYYGVNSITLGEYETN